MPPTSDAEPARTRYPQGVDAIGGPVSLAVRDRKDGKRAALSGAHRIVRQACHILAEFGDDELTAA
jgi:hypothetical protein